MIASLRASRGSSKLPYAPFANYCIHLPFLLYKPCPFSMAHPLPRFFPRRFASALRSFPRTHTFRTSFKAAAPRSQLHTTARRSVAGDGGGPRAGKDKITVLPFLAISAIGSGLYVLIVKSQAGKLLCIFASAIVGS